MERFVVGVDGSSEAAGALEWAIALARRDGAEVIAVLAIAPPTYLDYAVGYGTPITPPVLDHAWRSEIKRRFEELWTRPLDGAGVPYRRLLADGRPAEVLAAVADREEASLIVVGRRGIGGAAEMLAGSVSSELVHRSHRPVAIVPTARQRPETQAADAVAGNRTG